VNKFGKPEIVKLIDELRFQERRHRAFGEDRLADTLRDAADTLTGGDAYFAAVEAALI
jgi:hypothetical protein